MRFRGRIPVTLVGGFLGAGKTTLLNRLVASGGRRYGVVVNEFGDVGVDAALIEELPGGDIAELSGGCVCCVGREDLISVLYTLLTLKEPPEHILIELSGLADPVPAAQVIVASELSGMLELDGIVAVADARNLEETLREFPEGHAQVAYANVVMLNKADLVEEDVLGAAEALVQRINPLATIIKTSRSAVDVEAVVGLRAFSKEWKPAAHELRHAPGIIAFTLESDLPLDFAAWSRFRDGMLLGRSVVYRTKGFLRFEEPEHTVVFQSVRDLSSTTYHDGFGDSVSRLVVIGRDLDEADYREAFGRVSATTPVKRGGRS